MEKYKCSLTTMNPVYFHLLGFMFVTFQVAIYDLAYLHSSHLITC